MPSKSPKSSRGASRSLATAYPGGPVLEYQHGAPAGLFHTRYRLNEEITERTPVIYATDKLSRPPGKKVLIHVFHDLSDYSTQLELFKRLRSRFVANMLDHWKDELAGEAFIVLERGLDPTSFAPDDIQQPGHKNKKDCLLDVCSSWLFFYKNNYHLHLGVSSIMYFSPYWKVIKCVPSSSAEEMHPFECNHDLAEAIIDGRHRWESPLLEHQTIGMLLLELLLMFPLFRHRSFQDLHAMLSGSLVTQFANGHDERNVLELLAAILCIRMEGSPRLKAKDKRERDKAVRKFMNKANKVLAQWNTPKPKQEKIRHLQLTTH